MSYPLSLHSTDIGRANLRTLLEAAQTAGFEYAEPTIVQVQHFLDAGYSTQDVRQLAGGVKLSAMGWISNCERQGYEYVQMMKEAEEVFRIAAGIGAEAVEILNGPVDYHAVESYRTGTRYQGYMGLQGLPIEQQEWLTMKNLQALADLAAQFGLTIYFEALCWTPVCSPEQSVRICQRAERDNLKIVFDFFHAYIAGVQTEYISRIPKEMILGVHVCDSLEYPKGHVPIEPVLRRPRLGEGVVPIQEWVDAIRSTGFDRWWAYESFSPIDAEANPMELAKQIHNQLTILVNDKGK